MKKIFIDGSAGTTGLRIYDRLALRQDVELITLPEEERKDLQSRRRALNRADVVFLCLPDAAAEEATGLLENPETVVLDTSTAHRTCEGWVYGFPELSKAQEEKIRTARRIAVPGCHASGFIALVYPLIQAGLLPETARLTCHSLTGYSGGGKKMIAAYEDPQRPGLLDAPRQYGLSQQHKHLKEMKAVTGLAEEFPLLMRVRTPEDIRALYRRWYTGPVVTFSEEEGTDGFLPAGRLSGRDSMRISVFGNEKRILLTAVYDNLGKGASGAALECLNLVMGLDKAFGLEI